MIWVHGLAATPDDDSIYVSVDGGKASVADFKDRGKWTWHLISDRGAGEATVHRLSKGMHTLVIRNRESGTRIDSVIITNRDQNGLWSQNLVGFPT